MWPIIFCHHYSHMGVRGSPTDISWTSNIFLFLSLLILGMLSQERHILWWFLKKLKTGLPYDPVILLLGIYSKEMKSLSQKDICWEGHLQRALEAAFGRHCEDVRRSEAPDRCSPSSLRSPRFSASRSGPGQPGRRAAARTGPPAAPGAREPRPAARP